ncbi:lyase family protein [Rothia koreensis]|uniref:lyase family protein n=1 Tax=Rothia koreensis TaxID=592378 RepID=UPI003FCD7B61
MVFTDLLVPGGQRAEPVIGDAAVVRALVRAESAWVLAQADLGCADAPTAVRVASVLDTVGDEILAEIASEAEGGGNPVIGLVRRLKAEVSDPDGGQDAARELVHRGLTSQDVMDTALMLLVRDSLWAVHEALGSAADELEGLASSHAETPMAARTLGQHALPTTFGARAGRWLDAVAAAHAATDPDRLWLPVSGGGAAGTNAAVLDLAGSSNDDGLSMPVPDRLGLMWAQRLGLNAPASEQVWHTRRRPLIDAVEPLARAATACGKIAGDVVISSRNEIAELAEPAAKGRGGSSSMPHKRNPSMSILVRRSAVACARAIGELLESEALAVEERSDLAWHLEWEPIRTAARHSIIASTMTAEMLAGLEVDAQAMRSHLGQDPAETAGSPGTGNSADQARAAARRWKNAKEKK